MSDCKHVTGIVPADEEFKQKLEAYRTCERAKVPIPRELSKFFGDEEPNPLGREIRLTDGRNHASVTNYGADMVDGYTVDLAKLPPEVKLLRFTNHY